MLLIKYEANSMDLVKLKDPTLIGIFYLLNFEGNAKYVSIEEFCQKYNIEMQSIKYAIDTASNLKLIEVTTETNNTDTVIIIRNVAISKLQVDLVKTSLLLGIEIEQVKNAHDLAKGDITFFNTLILNLAKTKQETITAPNLIINTKEDVFNFLSTSNVFEVVAARGCVLSAKDIAYLIELTKSSLSIPVLNCLVDFCIKSNEYNNLNPNFCKKVHATWEANKIENIEKAIELINMQKNALAPSKNQYVEPAYEKFDEQASISENDAKELLNNVFGL